MAHLFFVSPPFLGHLNPMRALARALVARGHRATFVGMPDAATLVPDPTFGFHAVGIRSHPPGTLAAVTARMAAIDGPLGLGAVIRDVTDASATLLRELPDALRSLGADLLVCDGTEAAGALVAAHLDLPVVTVANALPLNREPAIPPPFTAWRYDPSPWGLERNAGGYRVADWLMRGHVAVLAEAAARWKLPVPRHAAECLSPFAQVGQIVAGLDFPRAELSPVFHGVGPLRDAAPPGRTARPDGARPLAFASLGTLQGGRERLFRRIVGAADRLGIRLVLAHGGRLAPAAAATLPGRPDVHAFVDQPAVLAGADVAILNGGLNTVMDALAAGVPVVALPIAFEQGAIAARLERAGAGRSVRRRFLTSNRLAAAIAGVLHDPAHRAASARLAAEIARAGGTGRAADIVEAVLRTGRPVLATNQHGELRCQDGPGRL